MIARPPGVAGLCLRVQGGGGRGGGRGAAAGRLRRVRAELGGHQAPAHCALATPTAGQDGTG